MKLPLFFIIALQFIVFNTNAQQTNKDSITISGKIVDSLTKVAVPNASIKLFDLPSTGLLTSVSSGSNGEFIFKNLSINKNYKIEITSVGFKTKTVSSTDLKLKVDLKEINLVSLNNELKEVSVSAQKVLIKQEIDRI